MGYIFIFLILVSNCLYADTMESTTVDANTIVNTRIQDDANSMQMAIGCPSPQDTLSSKTVGTSISPNCIKRNPSTSSVSRPPQRASTTRGANPPKKATGNRKKQTKDADND